MYNVVYSVLVWEEYPWITDIVFINRHEVIYINDAWFLKLLLWSMTRNSGHISLLHQKSADSIKHVGMNGLIQVLKGINGT